MIESETVQEWLDRVGVERQTVTEHVAVEEIEVDWAIAFQTAGGYTTVVAHPPVDFTRLLMQVELSVSDDHQSVLAELTENTRDRFYHDLRITLLQQPVGHYLDFADEQPRVLKSLIFQLNLFEDPVQMAGFFRRHHQLQSAAKLGAQMVKKLARFEEWSG